MADDITFEYGTDPGDDITFDIPTGAGGGAGTPGADGQDGADGADGDSAYEIAVAAGFVGNQAAWLASLVGPQGPQGEPGTDGADGVDGAPGATGATGPAGSTTIAGITGLQAALDGKASDLLAANNQTGTTYTLVLGDKSKVIEANNASAITLTVPLNSSVAFPVGTVIEVYQMGAGQVTITPTGGVTFRAPRGAKTAIQYGVASLWKRDTDTWVISGDVTP